MKEKILTDFIREGPNYIIRQMKKEEKKQIRKLVWQIFPVTEAWPFRITPNLLVVEHEGKLVGGAALRTFSLLKKRKGGFVEYIFTASEVQGKGFGQKLVEASIDLLKELGCDELMTQIKGDNTSSSKCFSTRGFTILSPGQQLRRYGIGIVPLWLGSMHILAKGQFLWVQTTKEKDKPGIQWIGSLITNILIFMLLSIRPDTGVQFNLDTFFAISTIWLYFFSVRYVIMKLTAKALSLNLRFRPIEDWFGMSIIMGLAGGIWIPVPGNLYPKEDTWTYRNIAKKLGIVALMGSSIVLASTWMLYFLPYLLIIPDQFVLWYHYALTTGGILTFLDTALPFFPLEVYNGKRIWNLNKVVWLIITTLGITVIILAVFF